MNETRLTTGGEAILRPSDLSFKGVYYLTIMMSYACFMSSVTLGRIYIFIPFLLSSSWLSSHILLLSGKIHSKSYNSNLIPRQRLIGKICVSIKYQTQMRRSVVISESDSSYSEILKEMTSCALIVFSPFEKFFFFKHWQVHQNSFL